MKLFELFDVEPLNVLGNIRSAVEDILIPLSAQGVPFTTVQAVIDELSSTSKNFGITVDRAVVLQCLAPDKTSIVKKIEGDKIYLDIPEAETSAKSEVEEEKDEKRVMKSATKQARRHLGMKKR